MNAHPDEPACAAQIARLARSARAPLRRAGWLDRLLARLVGPLQLHTLPEVSFTDAGLQRPEHRSPP